MIMAAVLVDKQIAEDEICARCVLHPLMFSESKGKLKDPAFQPKWGEHDASMLRLKYCTKEFCHQHGEHLMVDGQTYVGLAFITPKQVEEVNEWAVSEYSLKKYDGERYEVNGTEAHVIYAPMNNGKYVDVDIDVFTEGEIDLPMHVDLRYKVALDDDVRTRFRDFARQLMKKAKFEHK